ncbi:hypothetical protein HWV62_44621 [Athelia sp. TMB]|nr:hypothetical protein HWV62_44621 [Athelia sp. TMB]
MINILVAENGQVCISDYGMIEITPSKNASSYRYYSPEAWKGIISKASDVYAFAMSAYERLADDPQVFFSIPPWGVLSEDLVYRLVTREGDRPDRLESVSVEKGGISDNQWQIIEAAWQQNAALRPTFFHIIRLWQGVSADPPLQEATPPQSESSSSATSDNFLPTPFIASSSGENSSPGASDAVSVTSVPPAYIERPTATSPFQPSSVPINADAQCLSGNLRADARSVSDGDSIIGGPRPTIAMPLTRASSVRLSYLPLSPSHQSGQSSAGASSYFTFPDVVSMSQGPIRSPRMPSIDENEPAVIAQRPFSPTLRDNGPAYGGDFHWIDHRMSTPEDSRTMSDTQSFASCSQRGAPHSPIGRNPVLLAKALLAEVKEGRKQEVIDDYLDKVQYMCLQSSKEAQKLVTAGIVPTVLLLLQARAIDGVGLELVLVTLGILACDPITANTVNRTNTATVLVEIISSSDSDTIIALATWCVNRICRSAEVAANLIKLDLANMLIAKGLRGGPGASRMSSWCLGTLAYTDALAQTLASYDLIAASVRSLKTTSMNANASADDICAALFTIARLARTISLAKQLIRAGCIPLVMHHLSSSEDPQVLQWSARAVGCLMRPNGGDIAKMLLDAGAATGLARMPRVLPSDVMEPLAAFAFSIQRFSCAEWGSGTRKALVEAGVVDSLLAALRTAAETVEHPQVHIELALAVSFLGDVGGTAIRKEIVKAGGIDILKRVGAAGKPDVAKTCQMAVTSITGNLWTRNAGKIFWVLPRAYLTSLEIE